MKAGRKAQKRMETWSLRENIAGAVDAVQRAVAGVRGNKREEESIGS
jgi:hypothetical protein